MDIGTFVVFNEFPHVLIHRGNSSDWAVVVDEFCNRREVSLNQLDYLSRPLRSGDRVHTSLAWDVWGTVLEVHQHAVRFVLDDGQIRSDLLAYCWPGNWEQLPLDWAHDVSDKTTCGKSSWHSVHTYSSKGSFYYRYCWGRGDKIQGYQHIKGGNTDNPIAIARAEQVRCWIAEGKSRQWILNEVKKLERKRKK